MRKIIAALLVLVMLPLTACHVTVNNSIRLAKSDDIHTIVLVSDTQRYAQNDPITNELMMQKLVDGKDKYHIEYVVHTGDLVQIPEDDAQWDVAKKSLDILNGKIPYGVLAGNHDQVSGEDRFSQYRKYFGTDVADDGRAHSQLVKIGSREFIFVFISDDPDRASIDYANYIFASNPDKTGVLCTHRFLKEDYSPDDMGQYMLDNIIKNNKNVSLVLCGHESAAGCKEITLEDGRTVLSVISDYQDAETPGTMMYLQINETDNTLTGLSYSPIEKSYEGYAGTEVDSFTVNLPW